MIRVSRQGAMGLVELDRPEARNAINAALVEQITVALAELGADSSVFLVGIASTHPQVFASGGDLHELTKLSFDAVGADSVLALGESMARSIADCPVPVMALVEGQAFGGGAELALMCDLIAMTDTARLQLVHGSMGLTPAWGGLARLCEAVGRARASRWLFAQTPITAPLAEASGLAALIRPREELRGAAAKMAGDLAAGQSREALGRLKTAVREVSSRTVDARAQDVFRSAWGSAPHRDAFKRWKG